MCEKKVINKQTYTITNTVFEDGTMHLQLVNDGFKAFELLGLFDFIGQEIKEQIQGKIKPDIVKRQVIVD